MNLFLANLFSKYYSTIIVRIVYCPLMLSRSSLSEREKEKRSRENRARGRIGRSIILNYPIRGGYRVIMPLPQSYKENNNARGN